MGHRYVDGHQEESFEDESVGQWCKWAHTGSILSDLEHRNVFLQIVYHL